MGDSHDLQNPLRQADLDTNSTRYEYMVAAPPEDTLVNMWVAWAANQSVILLVCLVVFGGIILSRKVRSNAFNCYLIFLMIPDIFMTAGCLAVCAVNAATGHYRSLALCKFQSFSHIFGMTANAWLNAVVARQILIMLRASHSRRRYHPPTRRLVMVQSLIVYLWASFVASWGIVDVPWLPHGTSAANGMACVPVEESVAHTIFMWVAFVPAFLGFPSGYVLWVVFAVWRGGLLPPKGQRRMISIYFFRIIAVFMIMWIPTIITLYGMSGMWGKYPWFFWAVGAWTHYQSLLSALVSLMKPDIKAAVKNFICCGVCTSDISIELVDLQERLSSSRRSSVMMTVRNSIHRILCIADKEDDEICGDVELQDFDNNHWTLKSPVFPVYMCGIDDETGRRGQAAIEMTLQEEFFDEEGLGRNNLCSSNKQNDISAASRTSSGLRTAMVKIPEEEEELQVDLDKLFIGTGHGRAPPEITRARDCNRRASDCGEREHPKGEGLGEMSTHTI